MHSWLSFPVLVLTTMGSAAAQSTDPTVASLKGQFDAVRGFITKAAAQVPEDMYAFKPTPDVRSMGALFGTSPTPIS